MTPPTLRLSNNENAYGPSPAVSEALARLSPDLLARYADPLSSELAGRLAEMFGCSAKDLVIASGSSELLCQLHGHEGGVVLAEPAFPWYRHVCEFLDLRVQGVTLSGSPERDVSALVSAASRGASLLFVTNPNNPTGGYLPGSALARLLREVPEQVCVCIDEAYLEYADAPDFVSALEHRWLRERWLVLRTLSKAYGLAGVRVGWALGSDSSIQALRAARSPYSLSCFAERLACAALADPDHVAECSRRNALERLRLSKALPRLGVASRPSQANFYLADFGFSSRQAHQLLLFSAIETRLLSFTDRWLRISLGTEQQNDELLTRLESVLSSKERRMNCEEASVVG